ncbi:unnamed protein product [Prorocentrum cordatum]|uniref:MORN repeat-containing protein 5 n=1 Tax=Prorocentrum cordatum TaxID=2364126 RepID=A0ABN9TF55_9DINO|nr:unnamed protein product [Polarella glacialis]
MAADGGAEGAAPPASGELPPMQRPLDEILTLSEEVYDLETVTRECPDGKGSFQAVHHVHMPGSLMAGSFKSKSSTGGVTTYEGTFLCDPHNERPTPSGQGTRTNADGSTYTGQWKDGFPDGRGELRGASGGYVGEWKRGKKHGHGIMKFDNGDCYEGDWAHGLFQDRGKYTYASGDEFLGTFENGMKKQGTFYFADGHLSVRKYEKGFLVSCQEFSVKRQAYQPTLTKEQVHAPERNTYGATISSGAVVSPRGIRFDHGVGGALALTAPPE